LDSISSLKKYGSDWAHSKHVEDAKITNLNLFESLRVRNFLIPSSENSVFLNIVSFHPDLRIQSVIFDLPIILSDSSVLLEAHETIIKIIKINK
jgi:hypothetical protein